MTAYLRKSNISDCKVTLDEGVSISDEFRKSKLALQNKIRISKDFERQHSKRISQASSYEM
jgi:hypothetical protein